MNVCGLILVYHPVIALVSLVSDIYL